MRLHPRLILYLGVLAVTTSSFIIRFADQDAYSLAASRVLLTGLFSLILSTKFNYSKLQISRKEIGLIILSGMSLASHFAWWFESLSFLPIGTSLSLTNTAPVWLVIISVLIYKKFPSKNSFLSILLVVLGTTFLFIASYSDTIIVQGLLLALGSAIGFAIYLLIAKELVNKVGLWRYFGMVNLTAGITLLIVLFLSGNQGITNVDVWQYGVVLAIVPGMLGHATYNWAMSKIDQVDVALATLGEPVLGTFFAWVVFSELLKLEEFLGVMLLLSAILLSLVDKKITELIN